MPPFWTIMDIKKSIDKNILVLKLWYPVMTWDKGIINYKLVVFNAIHCSLSCRFFRKADNSFTLFKNSAANRPMIWKGGTEP